MRKDDSLDTFIGEVIGVIYRNDETGYTVMKIRTTEGLRITVVHQVVYQTPDNLPDNQVLVYLQCLRDIKSR